RRASHISGWSSTAGRAFAPAVQPMARRDTAIGARLLQGAHLDTTTGTQPSGCRVVSIAPCCSVNAAFLFAEPHLVVVVARCCRFSERLSAEQAGGIYSAPAVGGLKSALEFGHLAVRNRVTCGLCPHFVGD